MTDTNNNTKMSDPLVMKKQANHMIDFIKGIAALGVILVHFQFPGVFGRIMCSIGVSGVVFFYLVSGYFAFDPDDEKACRNLLKRFKRNLFITAAAVLIYLLFTVIEQAVLGTIGEWAKKLRDPLLYVRMVFLGDFEFMHGDPLWFMPALLYAYLILYVFHRCRISKYAYVLLPVLLLLRIGMESYTNSFGADWHLSGNVLVGAMPIMLLGHYFAYKKETFSQIPLFLTVPFLLISMALLFVSVNVPFFGLDVSQIFKIWLASEAFLLALRLPEKRGIPALEVLGKKYSLYIYLFHYLIGVLFIDILIGVGAPDWVRNWVLPVVVTVASILVAAAICKVKGRLHAKKQ